MNKTTLEALKLAEKAANRAITTLEYLKNIGVHSDSIDPTIRAEKKALAAIREALADHSGDANEMVAEPAIPEWVDVDDYEEPVKQEPVAFEQCEELSADKARWYRMADMIEQQAQELKGVLRQALNLIEGEWPEGDEVAQPVVDKIKKIVGERHDI